MSTRTRALSRLAAIAGGIAIVSAATAFPAVAADGDVQVVNTETVKAYTDATGKVTSKKLYEQLVLTGDGAVDLANPVETSGLRNLDGFSGFDVEDGDQLVEIDVDGHENLRSVSSYDEDLPLDIEVDYVLDGEPISPTSLVGKSGDLEVTYTVRNGTTQPQTITYTDGKGGTVEETAEVMMPMVGSLATTLPPSFRDVEAGGASAAGDGKGGTKLSYTMTLLAPLGSDVVELGYTATVVDAVAPPASVSALPVNPLDNPTLANAAKSYKGGADTGERLAAGASEIDANLLKLRDGASDLLAGLIKLRNGADQLSEGLQEEAAPGARKLADGAGDLNDGLGKLDDGAGRLADGTEDLRDGTGQLADGAGKLDDGAGRLADGADKASTGSADLAAGLEGLTGGLKDLRDGVAALPASVRSQLQSNPDYQRLLGGLGALVQGIGTPSDATPNTLLGGLNLLKYGLRSPLGTANCDQDTSDDNKADDCGAADANQIMAGKFGAGKTAIQTQLLPSAVGAYTALRQTQLGLVSAGLLEASAVCAPVDGGLPPLSNLGLPNTNPCKAAAVSALGYGAAPGTPGFADGGLLAQATLAEAVLTRVYQGLDNQAIPGIERLKRVLSNPGCNPAQQDRTAADFCGYAQNLAAIQQGIPTLVDGILAGIQTQLSEGIGTRTTNCDPQGTLLCAAGALAAGGGELSNGLGELAAGADKLAAGTGELNDGVGRLDEGANKLADGAGELKGGTAKAEAGSLLIADGAAKLADGLLEAAGGSGLLADGLATAAEGAPKLVDGAQRLSDEGTKKLVEAGEATAQDYGKQYSLIMAGAERAQDGKMVVGAPEQAVGLAAYSFEIQGEDGEGNRNLARALGGLGLLGAGAGLFALRRRFI